MFMKKLKPYFLTVGIVFGIFLILFMGKGIYPFGPNSLIWGDMHDQITSFYYHFYDTIYGTDSLLVDFSSSGGVNFIGILAYYILSPFTLLVLLVPREDIYLMVSVIVALKILLSSLTCLYFIRTFFPKQNPFLSVFLAIIYAFSGYSLMMYQITSWIDAMYLFPLIMIGLKKTLDLEKPTFYIVTLTLSLIFSFYVSMILLIFLFLVSFLYLLVYQEEKEARKKGILALGISTILSLLLSAFIVVPSYLQISISSRIGFKLNYLLNSGLGPITDKIAMFLFGGLMYCGLFLLLKEYRKHRKFLSFYLPILLLMLIPVLIEPIHKVWHFGSYAFFPYRMGFIPSFLLIVGACVAFSKYEEKKKKTKTSAIVLSIFVTILTSSVIIFLIFRYYPDFQTAINHLTLSGNHFLLLILILAFLVAWIGCEIIFLLFQKLNFLPILLMGVITFVHIFMMSSIYLGMDQEQDILTSQFEELAAISKDYSEGDYDRVKNEASNMIMNSGVVMKYHTIDHFTSLTNENNLKSLKKLGYSSMWVKTFSKGGNLFLDGVLANRYIMTREEVSSPYYELVKRYGDLNFYSLKEIPSYGYLMSHNDTIFDKKNSFEISNSIYQNICDTKENIFDIIEDFDFHNIQMIPEEPYQNYEIIDKDANNYLEAEVEVKGRKNLYLEILRSLDNNDNYDMYENFHIYINDQLFLQNAFSENDNGALDLGIFENETVNIKIQFKDDMGLDHITLGMMDLEKYEDFIQTAKLDTNIKYHRNQISVQVSSAEEGKILFLPINYNEGYHATNQGKKVEIIQLYDNFIGIPLEQGENQIEISFIPKGLIPCILVSIFALVVTIMLLRTRFYFRILEQKPLMNIAYYLYVAIYLAMILVVYIGLTIIFIISYFTYVKF